MNVVSALSKIHVKKFLEGKSLLMSYALSLEL